MDANAGQTAPTAAPLTFTTAPEWVRLEAASQLAGGISPRTIRRWVGARLIRASKPGGGILLIERDSLRAHIERAAR